MKRTVKIDPFFDRQPPLRFIDELKSPVHTEKPDFWNRKEARKGEVEAKGIYIRTPFPDEGGLLDTAYADFANFSEIYGIAGSEYPVDIVRGETECFEAYTIDINAGGVTITAADTEGARRAVIELEDELRRREGPFLPQGRINRRPYVKSRITRCFFSPINRPPKYGDELSDDIDYYPEEYLNRLMHDGTNGVWIYTRFSDLVPSSVFEEYGKGYEARIEKLNRVIDKCARYGIGVYVFAIEPVALNEDMAKKYPELCSQKQWGGTTLCVNTEGGYEYCRESGRRLAELCPGLAGFISITYGERTTSCSSAYPNIQCPRCSKMTPGEVLAKACDALRSGFREVNPAVKVVSWTYGHRTWEHTDILDYVRHAPDDVMLMQNFEDMGYAEQLGRLRQAEDYWLSYAGPSELFRITAEQAKESDKHIWAKMQVCCSHELASVPYIPVPGILWEKYSAARALGVTGVMQCWYFGNYPSMMSKAAGMLSFIGEFNDRAAFLHSLAGIYFGNSRAAAVSEAWECFAGAYENYPLNVMFSYYGPAHDSVVWKLALLPVNRPLPRTWQSLDPIDGDRIGECLLDGHTLEEALELLSIICAGWEKGTALLENTIEALDCEASREHLSLVRALRLLFSGARDILCFYLLRDRLGRREGDAPTLLSELRGLVKTQISYSEAMIPLCETDGRLGYHSEAEGFKFFPEKLTDRIEHLKQLLDTEFPEVERRIADGLAPLAYYQGEDGGFAKRCEAPENIEDAQWQTVGSSSRFRAAVKDTELTLELVSDTRTVFTLCPEWNLMWPAANVSIAADGKKSLGGESRMYYSLFGDRYDKQLSRYDVKVLSETGTHLTVKVNLAKFGLTAPRVMKLKLRAGSELWQSTDDPVRLLGKGEVSPGEYGWIIPIMNENR